MTNTLADKLRHGRLNDADAERAAELLEGMPDAPDGYELTGEYRAPKDGEWFFYNSLARRQTDSGESFWFTGDYHILRKLEAQPPAEPPAPKFKAGQYVVETTRKHEIGRVTSIDGYTVYCEWERFPSEEAYYRCSCQLAPWQPKVGDEVWVDGSGKWRIAEVACGARFVLRKDRNSCNRFEGIAALHPIAFAPRQEAEAKPEAQPPTKFEDGDVVGVGENGCFLRIVSEGGLLMLDGRETCFRIDEAKSITGDQIIKGMEDYVLPAALRHLAKKAYGDSDG